MDQDGTRVFGEESGLPKLAIVVIRKDVSGNIWVRAKSEGVFVLQAGQKRFQRPDSPVPGSTMGGVPQTDTDGRMLLPTANGLLIHGKTGWQKVDRSAGLRGDVYSAFEDRQRSLWIGLAGRGLVQWRGYQEWETYSTSSGLASDVVYEILPRPDGTMWVGTEGGLLRGQREKSGIQWTKIPELTGFPVHAVREAPNGDLWIGTEMRGVGRFEVKSGHVHWFGESQGLVGKAGYILQVDREGRLWAGTEAGLFVATEPYHKFSQVAELPPARIFR
jgi:ligand-binding sensor domain-containing protein